MIFQITLPRQVLKMKNFCECSCLIPLGLLNKGLYKREVLSKVHFVIGSDSVVDITLGPKIRHFNSCPRRDNKHFRLTVH